VIAAGVLTVDRQIALELLRTLRSNELLLMARDAARARLHGRRRVEYGTLTLETMRAREWLEAEICDVGALAVGAAGG
jgi:hypothetical protein